jgi:EgtB-related family protein
VRQLPLFALLVPGVTMNTTGLDAIRELYEARQRTLGIYSHLDLESLRVPCLPIVNPPLWELAHVAWFQEYWCLRGGDDAAPSLLPRSDALFNSSTVPHDSRWHLDYPSTARLRQYIDDTLEATQEALSRTPEDGRYFFELALRHEDMHSEALLMTLQTLELPAPAVERREPVRASASPAKDIAYAGGEFVQGSEAHGFTFDNERGAHRVTLAPFAMASRPVSQGEFAEYVDATGATPRYWKRQGNEWLARRYAAWAPIDPHAPMIHVSKWEADAYCKWAGRRLPSESEWEFAAPRAAGVWEWTSTPFAPYPGFSPDPYRDYSEPWFHTHCVLRGGSFAAHPRIAQPRYRNFYLPQRADPFAGFRTCAV